MSAGERTLPRAHLTEHPASAKGGGSRGQEEGRNEEVARRVAAALRVIDEAVAEHRPTHMFALFSGGHDSLCSTAVAAKHPAFAAAVHINTGIGIEQTREFVRNTCRARGWPLIEMHPDAKTYGDLVAEKGMPGGPRAHNTMYYWLKQRQVRRLVAEHKQGRHGRVALVTGIRVAESERRMAAVMSVPVHRIGAQVWVNPILDWTKADCHDCSPRCRMAMSRARASAGGAAPPPPAVEETT